MWQTEWPTEPAGPGEMWLFYGHRFRDSQEPGLFHTKIVRGRGRCSYVCEGVFLYKGESRGVWKKIEVGLPTTGVLEA